MAPRAKMAGDVVLHIDEDTGHRQDEQVPHHVNAFGFDLDEAVPLVEPLRPGRVGKLVGVDLLEMPVHVVCEIKDDREFRDLGGLERDRAQRDPAVEVFKAGGRRHQKDRDQQGEGDEQDGDRPPLQDMVVDTGHDEQDDDAEDCKRQLTFEVVETVVEIVVGIRRTRREHHHESQRDQCDNDDEKRDVQAAPDQEPAFLFGFRVLFRHSSLNS